MRFANVHRLIHFTPWLILPLYHASIRAVFESKIGVRLDDQQNDNDDDGDGWKIADFIVQRRQPSFDPLNLVGSVHMMGVVGSGLARIDKTCGMTDFGDVISEINALIAQGARGIMLDIDSPGGTVYGTAEFAEALGDVPVPVVVHVDSGLMCSAAYWAGCGADRIYATASSEVGSIGVYIPWADQSARYKAAGVQMELITNKEGIYKGAGYPGTSLTDDQRASWQASVDRIYADFAGAVVKDRGNIDPEAMRGQCFGAAEAVQIGLIDGVASRASAMGALKVLMTAKQPLESGFETPND